MSVWVCAEMASAHDGDLEKAKRLIDAAIDAGCDAVKHVWWSDADALADRRKVPDYYRAIYRKYQTPREWLPILDEYCKGRIEFGCSVYLERDAEVAAPHVNFLKVASFEAGSVSLLRAAYRAHGRVIVSSGMMDDAALCGLLSFVGPHGTVLHCVSGYPAPIEAANLAVVERYELDGYSDHHADVRTGAWAVQCGARMLEVHLRGWDTEADNPDYRPALNLDELKRYVYLAHHPEKAGPVPPEVRGNGIKRQMPVEAGMAQYRVKA